MPSASCCCGGVAAVVVDVVVVEDDAAVVVADAVFEPEDVEAAAPEPKSPELGIPMEL